MCTSRMNSLFTSAILIISTLTQSRSIPFGKNVGSDPEVDRINNIVLEHVLAQANKPISFNMQNPVNPFIGRTAELSEIKWAQIDRKITVISGQRGVGKTELARKYAQDFRHDNLSSTIYIDAGSHESIIASFKDLAIRIGIEQENKNILSIITECINFFNGRKSVIIFDNAGINNELVNQISRLAENKNVNIIIVSRDDNWSTNYKIINLQPFNKDESNVYLKTVLQRSITLNVDNSQIDNLIDRLGNLPLTLFHAVKYIGEQHLIHPNKNMNDLLSDLDKKEIVEKIIVETVTRQPTEGEIEDFLLDKLNSEAKSISGKISEAAVNTWEKVSGGVGTAKDFVVDKANVAYKDGIRVGAEKVASFAKDVGSKIGDIFG